MKRIRSFLIAVLLLALGYGLKSWFVPTNVRGQEATAAVERFQLVKGIPGAQSDGDTALLDTVNGQVFRFITDDHHNPELVEIPVKSCNNDDCSAWKNASLDQR